MRTWTGQGAEGFIQINATTGRITNGSAETSQAFSYDFDDEHARHRGSAYWRSIEAKGGHIVKDTEGGVLAPHSLPSLYDEQLEWDRPPPRWLVGTL